jgi:hypothetical protein
LGKLVAAAAERPLDIAAAEKWLDPVPEDDLSLDLDLVLAVEVAVETKVPRVELELELVLSDHAWRHRSPLELCPVDAGSGTKCLKLILRAFRHQP